MNEVNLFDALEICLQALDKGADLESCLALFPALAADLRPILQAAIQARLAAVTVVPEAAARRGKERVLQAAAEMREQRKPAPFMLPIRRKNFFSGRFLRLAITTAAVLGFLLTGGTGLVNASTSAIPGDRLYPVKRSWEGVRLFFVIDTSLRQQLEVEYENERLKEIHELYSINRMEKVDFQGRVETRQNEAWVVGGLNVTVTAETVLSGEILPGATVEVIGETEEGLIKAEEIRLVAAPGMTPTPGFSPTIESSESPDHFETPEPSETPEIIKPENTVASPEATREPEKTPEYQNPTQKPEGGTETKPTESKTEEAHPTETGETH